VAARAPIIIVGAGIGGLTAALALARSGYGVKVFEQASELEDIGAGIQLSPNASRVLLAIGLGDKLKPHVITPAEVHIRASNGSELAHIPLGRLAEARYGAPYWVLHRGDLQAVLVDAVRANPDITLTLNAEINEFSVDGSGVTIRGVRDRTDFTHYQATDGIPLKERGLVLIGADGINSTIRLELHPVPQWLPARHAWPRYANRTACRATIPYTAAPDDLRDDRVHLWLGRNAHLVHYPVKGGTAINVVAITRDSRDRSDWAAPEAAPADVLIHFPRSEWSQAAYKILAAPECWLRWPLFDRPPSRHWGRGPVTLLGDAAHAGLPFLAQGAAMAIEDAAVLADCLRTSLDAPEQALRRYEDERQARTARVQRTARRNGLVYHLSGPAAAARDYVLRNMSGERLLTRYDWLYDWRPPSDPD